MFFRKSACVLFIVILLFLTACVKKDWAAQSSLNNRVEFALGTVCSITLFDSGKDRVYKDIFNRIREIENLMSVNIPASDVSRVNAAAGIEPVQVHADVFKVIKRAIYYAELSGGTFDPSVGPLVSLWGIGGGSPKVPSPWEIEEVLPLVNWRNIELDENSGSVFLKQRGMSLDLGAIAKGYAADEAAEIITKAGIKRAIIDLGGDIVVLGENENLRPWNVGIQSPGEQHNEYLGILRIPSEQKHTVVTSGVYERFFELEGVRYHHIFSPDNGYPAGSGLLSVTVIAHNAIDADAVSTAVFVLGYEKGMELIDSLSGTEAVFVFSDKSVQKTDGVDFTITDNSFMLVN